MPPIDHFIDQVFQYGPVIDKTSIYWLKTLNNSPMKKMTIFNFSKSGALIKKVNMWNALRDPILQHRFSIVWTKSIY